jgi:hypothetical protein
MFMKRLVLFEITAQKQKVSERRCYQSKKLDMTISNLTMSRNLKIIVACIINLGLSLMLNLSRGIEN